MEIRLLAASPKIEGESYFLISEFTNLQSYQLIDKLLTKACIGDPLLKQYKYGTRPVCMVKCNFAQKLHTMI